MYIPRMLRLIHQLSFHLSFPSFFLPYAVIYLPPSSPPHIPLCSLFARQWVKDLLSLIIPPAIYRQFYFIMSSLTFFLIAYGWSPLPQLVWNVDALPVRYVLYSEYVCGHVFPWLPILYVHVYNMCMYMCFYVDS